MGEHNKFYPIDRPEPSPIFLRAFQAAGGYLQRQIESNGGFSYISSGFFKWIKAELVYPSFDNLTLAYKNRIFSIAIDILDDENKGTLPRFYKERLVAECEKHDLIPCVFPIRMKSMSPFRRGWNLITPFSHEDIDPMLIASDEPRLMSDWEINNFGIQIVRDYLYDQKMNVLSYCDLLDIKPQIWFEDRHKKRKWVYVKNSQYPNSAEFDGFDIPDAIKEYEGFFAGVSFMPIEKTPPKDWNMYRDQPAEVNFEGLLPIHSPASFTFD